MVYFNAPTMGSEIHMPFGDMKAITNGHRDLGTGAVKEFSVTKSIFVSYPVQKE
jgi:alpha-ketoglutaric semialdehyde dehydrogenase